MIPRWNPYIWSMLLVLPSAFVVYRFLGSVAVYAYAPSVFLLVRFAYEPVQQTLEEDSPNAPTTFCSELPSCC